MNRLTKTAIAAALATASVSASAFWGWGGPGGWGDDVFGGGGMDFGFHASGHGSGWSRYADYYAPYWAHPYGGYPYYGAQPYAPTEEQQAAMAEQQKVLAEQQKAFGERQAKAFQEAVAAQRKLAEEMAANRPETLDPYADLGHPAARIFSLEQELMQHAAEREREFFERVREDFARPAPASRSVAFAPYQDRVQEMDARREEVIKEMESRREESRKRIEAQRKAIESRRGVLPVAFEDRPAPRDI
ncbi:MAG: hypothetical protein PVG98_11690 [Chromatiales bacterium]|jgi:hypothetical protein